MLIRYMEERDIPVVARLEQEAFSEPWSEKAFHDSMKLSYSLFLVAEEEEELAGYAGMYLVADEGDVTNVAVFEKWKRHGVGTMLVNAMLQEAKKRGATAATLEVRKSNCPAITLYEKAGFESVGIRKNFYDYPKEDAVIMWKYEL